MHKHGKWPAATLAKCVINVHSQQGVPCIWFTSYLFFTQRNFVQASILFISKNIWGAKSKKANLYLAALHLFASKCKLHTTEGELRHATFMLHLLNARAAQ